MLEMFKDLNLVDEDFNLSGFPFFSRVFWMLSSESFNKSSSRGNNKVRVTHKIQFSCFVTIDNDGLHRSHERGRTKTCT